MGKDIEDFISNCTVCKSYQPNQQKEPMISHEIPTRPWEKVGCDLFDFEDKHYLVCVDYYSDYFELDRICDKKGKEVISKLKSQFARHGIPVQVFSDNGPPFSSKEFQEFVSAYEFEHLTSSPCHPQSNGKVENAVKIAQSIMVKARDVGSGPNLSLLDYRNTPAEGVGSSPSQRLFGRRTRTLLSTSSRLLVPETVQGVPHKLKERKAKQTYYYNRGAKELSKLEPGVVVCIKPDSDSKRWAKATVDKGLTLGHTRSALRMAGPTEGTGDISGSPGSHSSEPYLLSLQVNQTNLSLRLTFQAVLYLFLPIWKFLVVPLSPSQNQNQAMNLFPDLMMSVQFLFLLPVRLRLL